MSEQFAIDKAILDEMLKYNQFKKMMKYNQFQMFKEGESTLPDPLEPFKQIYNKKYSIESSSPQVFAPESMADDLFEIYRYLEPNKQEEAKRFLENENKIVEEYFKKNPQKDIRKKMM